MYSRRYFLAALFTALGFVLLAAALGGFLGWPLLIVFMAGMGFLLASVLVTPPMYGQDKGGRSSGDAPYAGDGGGQRG
jgi:hypothetical protein